MTITDNQRKCLQSLLDGPGNIPAVHAGKLKAAGYVEPTGESSGQRGYAHVKLTDAGRAKAS